MSLRFANRTGDIAFDPERQAGVAVVCTVDRHESGCSWTEIGEALGTSKQAAWERFSEA
jgi:hypothetical protein